MPHPQSTICDPQSAQPGAAGLQPPLTGLTREILRPRRRIGIEEWARAHLRIVEGPLVGHGRVAARWSPDIFPLQAAVMDAIADRRWAKVFLMTSPQAFGKTLCAALPPLLHALEHRRVSALYVAANAMLATTQWRKKFKRTMLADPDLQRLLPDESDQTGLAGSRDRRDFVNGTSLHFAGGESVGNLSAFTAAVVVCDDLQAYPPSLPGFGHPADLAWARSEAFPPAQVTHVGLGTAGTVEDYLWRNLRSSALFCPFVPCLGCGTLQLLEFSRLEFAATDPAAALAATTMRCANPQCPHPLTFAELPEMLRRHQWISCPPDQDWVTQPDPQGVRLKDEGGRMKDEKEKPAGGPPIHPSSFILPPFPHTARKTNVAGFWANALYWPLGKTWGERAAEFMSCVGKPDELKDFQQRVRVVPWAEPEEDENALTVEAVAAHRLEGHRRGTVPAAADVVTLTVDVHDRYLYYVVRAWRGEDGTSWLVDAGTQGVHGPRSGEKLSEPEKVARVGQAIRHALEDVWAMEAAGWPTLKPDGEVVRMHRAAAGLIDGGYRPDAVGQFCLQRNAGLPRRKWYMTRGRSELKGAKAIWPKRPFRNKRGLLYWDVNVDEAKHTLRELLGVPRDRPGAWRVYGDRELTAYYWHMVSEHFVTQRIGGREVKKWMHREGGGPNHWWDCEVLQIAAALSCQVNLRGIGQEWRIVRPRPPTDRPALRTPDGRPYLITERQ